MLGLKTAIMRLIIGIGKWPCELTPPVEMEPEAGDTLYLEVLDRAGKIKLRVKADIEGALIKLSQRTERQMRKAKEDWKNKDAV